jgi:hypothetical protein
MGKRGTLNSFGANPLTDFGRDFRRFKAGHGGGFFV